MGRQNPEEDNKIFRLTFVDDKTHRPLWALRFKRHGLALTIASVLMLFIALAYIIICVTPLRTTIPGYPDADSRKAAVTNAIKIDSLENAMTRWSIYAENLRAVLNGEQTGSLDSLLKAGTAAPVSGKNREELARRDSLLRETVRREEQFQISGVRRALPLEGMHFFAPANGVVILGFDRLVHPAIDISAPAGSVVGAVYDGTVISVLWDESDGNVIIIQHEGDLVSIYKHNQKVLKKVGETVKAGTPIALVGSTSGLTKKDHLHFEMWYKGAPADPAKYIGFQ